MKRFYLVDVSSLFFRAFYAIRQLNNSKGLPTNALYGFLAAVTKILREHKPEGVAFCFDRPEAGFREEIYPDYKANRSEPPDDLIKQFPYLPKIAEALAVPTFDHIGYEADDLIGTLTKRYKGPGVEIIIVSGDKDFAQLVGPGVTIFDPAKDTYMNEDGVRAKFGVNPSQIIDYLALVGDASDNVPGVNGIGPKGAQKLLNEFENLDGIYRNLEKIKNERTRELIRGQKDQAYLSQKLVTIHCDMKIETMPDSLNVKPVNRAALVPLLEELEFKSLLQRLVGSGAETPVSGTAASEVSPGEGTSPEKIPVEIVSPTEAPPVPATVTSDLSDLEKAFSKMETPHLWFDVTSRGTAIQMGDNVFRFEGDGEKLTAWLNEKLAKSRASLSGYDTKGIAHQLNLHPDAFCHVHNDVLLEAYCTGKQTQLDVNDLVKTYLGRELPEFALPEERLHAVRAVSLKVQDELKSIQTIKVLTDIEQPLVPVLYRMEKTGILIDSARLNAFSGELLKETLALEKDICAMAGYEFNVGSPKQLGQVLFEKLKLPTVRKTKTGYSTDSDVLEKLSVQHPICSKVLEWRELSKLRSTYADALPRLADSRDGRVHTSYNQALTLTGRLSSTHPNLQNIPIRTARGQKIRESFVAPQGSVLISADYSQVELRILAHITGDAGLRRAFADDVDIHTATASEVFSVKREQVTADQRRAAKAINFGIAYGMSDFGLAESLGVKREVAADFIGKYFAKFPGVQKYMHEVVENGKRDQFVETIFGRRRYYPGLESKNRNIQQMAERAAINMPIQGAAADIIKIAMISIAQKMKSEESARMLLQVHDELIFEVNASRAKVFQSCVKDWMENAVKLAVPLKVSVGVGPNWGAAH